MTLKLRHAAPLLVVIAAVAFLWLAIGWFARLWLRRRGEDE